MKSDIIKYAGCETAYNAGKTHFTMDKKTTLRDSLKRFAKEIEAEYPLENMKIR